MNSRRYKRLIITVLLVLQVPLTALAEIRIMAKPLEDVIITVERSVPAEVISLREATVASQLTTTVLEIPLLVGDVVVEDQIISRLDCVDNDLALEQSKAELAELVSIRVLARQQLDRLNKLRKSNNASEEEINQKQAELNTVSARMKGQNIAINIAQRQVDKCLIRSPFSGSVIKIHTELGNFVTPGSSMMTIVDTKNIELSTRVSYSDLDQISTSSELIFVYNDENYPVSIRTTLNVVDLTTQSRHMRLTFSADKPLPGAHGRLKWILDGNIIPASLIVSRGNEKGIFIVDESASESPVARFISIPEAKPGQPALVNMESNTLIVVDGRFGLVDGDKVLIN